MIHFARSRNLLFLVKEIKKTFKCKVCVDLKPRFYKPSHETLIKVTQHFETIPILRGYYCQALLQVFFLTIIEEYSKFPFGSPNMMLASIVKCQLFGILSFIH